MRFGKAGDGIRKVENMFTLVSEMLSNGHRGQGASPPFQGRTIRGCRNHNAARHTFRTQDLCYKIQHLSPALPHERQDNHVSFDPLRQLREQPGLANA
ncbi:hypothetical protein GCM10022290_19250 [Sagittula marina]